MRVNLEAIRDKTMNQVVPDVLRLFGATVEEFKGLVSAPPEPVWETTRTELQIRINALDRCRGRLAGLSGRPLSEAERGAILFELGGLGSLCDALNALTDPDAPLDLPTSAGFASEAASPTPPDEGGQRASHEPINSAKSV